MRHRRNQSGFTLIELVIVVTIIGLLAAIAVVNVKYAHRKAAENVLRADLANMRKAIDDFYADKQRYPASLQELVDAHYMRMIPADPITKSADTWQEIAASSSSSDTGLEPVPSDTAGDAAGGGIEDVKSGAEGTTLDGVAYGDL